MSERAQSKISENLERTAATVNATRVRTIEVLQPLTTPRALLHFHPVFYRASCVAGRATGSRWSTPQANSGTTNSHSSGAPVAVSAHTIGVSKELRAALRQKLVDIDARIAGLNLLREQLANELERPGAVCPLEAAA